MLTITPMIVVLRLAQHRFGLAVALALAWPLVLAELWAFRKQYMSGDDDET